MERGAIRDRGIAAQLRNFKGLRWGNITPTDIDGIVEFRDKAYVIFELKYGVAEVPYGQRLAIDRMCTDLEKANKKVLGMIARHSTPAPGDIDAASACVVEIWDRKVDTHWRPPVKPLTVLEAINTFLQHNGILYD